MRVRLGRRSANVIAAVIIDGENVAAQEESDRDLPHRAGLAGTSSAAVALPPGAGVLPQQCSPCGDELVRFPYRRRSIDLVEVANDRLGHDAKEVFVHIRTPQCPPVGFELMFDIE